MSGAPMVLTQGMVEADIVRISNEMESAVEELATYANQAAEAEVDFKVGYAKAMLRAGIYAGGKITVGDKDAKATVETEQQLRRRLISEAKHSVAQEKLRTMRSRLDALRTISANIRAQT